MTTTWKGQLFLGRTMDSGNARVPLLEKAKMKKESQKHQRAMHPNACVQTLFVKIFALDHPAQ